ncbi:HNH endonuclease [Tenacibaculum finnmarkense]|uniref:HNH endonuclease n=2 Tax=Tenacibaculum finnmarkense TaxID=2781243 RepID=A0A2I2MA98_9FLAO|nr:HNH endonuclease [Tenacibaculum finnmarkense]MCD8431018.1 HNH endonuclease [Tenacibaculum finnmarkense genomovar ulcerans]MCG8813290.1 HNH endonuclease [Tenacibaculum finnmarkense]SOU89462.1 HNH endonuclease [Tenacibaculum finnmarkense genomovar ulcerans]
MKQEVTRNFYNEKWAEIQFDNAISKNEKFIISTYGRVINCKNKPFLVKESFTNGYRSLAVKKENGNQTGRYVHKLVAQTFLDNINGVFVIHLNYDKSENHISNLKWATKREKEIHQHKNPEYIAIMRGFVKHKPINAKLTATKVMRLKKRIFNPKRKSTIKRLAKEFGISEMQVYRIKNGVNWGYIRA